MNVMRARVCVAVLLAVPGSVFVRAQGPGPSPTLAAQKEAMQKVAFLVGEWKGTGWMMMGPGRKEDFTSRQKVESRLDGLVLIIEGVHESTDPARKGAIVHHALAELSWDAKQSAYRFRSHLATGEESDFQGKVVDGAFIWTFDVGRGGTMRYTIKLDTQGRWNEIGERSTDGQNWQQVFGMTLDRVK